MIDEECLARFFCGLLRMKADYIPWHTTRGHHARDRENIMVGF
jgi:hypothetical protein